MLINNRRGKPSRMTYRAQQRSNWSETEGQRKGGSGPSRTFQDEKRDGNFLGRKAKDAATEQSWPSFKDLQPFKEDATKPVITIQRSQGIDKKSSQGDDVQSRRRRKYHPSESTSSFFLQHVDQHITQSFTT